MAAEVIAFADLFDEAFTLRAQLEKVFNQPVLLHLLPDSKPLFGLIGKSSRTTEMRLVLDISAIGQVYIGGLTSHIGYIR